MEYIPEVKSATMLGLYNGFEGIISLRFFVYVFELNFNPPSFTNCQAWTLGYRFMPPISNRTFTILIVCVLEDSPTRQGLVISLPLDVSLSVGCPTDRKQFF